MISKTMKKAMITLYKEQKRRSNLPIRNNKYINEIKYVRKFIRKLYRKLALFKPRNGKYPVLLSEDQIMDIENFYEVALEFTPHQTQHKNFSEDYQNFKNQVKVLRGEK